MSNKTLDNKGRLRSKVIAFRVSPEESKQLDQLVKLSGLSKQEYLSNRALQKEVVVVASPYVHKCLSQQLSEFITVLKDQSALEKMNSENKEILLFMMKILSQLKEDKNNKSKKSFNKNNHNSYLHN